MFRAGSPCPFEKWMPTFNETRAEALDAYNRVFGRVWGGNGAPTATSITSDTGFAEPASPFGDQSE